MKNNFIKGICVEFTEDVPEDKVLFWHYPFRHFMNKIDEILSAMKEASLNALFIHFMFCIDDEKIIRLRNENADFKKLFNKCAEYGIMPVVKIMNEHRSTTQIDNLDNFFERYKKITKFILDQDVNKKVTFITIGNETGLLRKYCNCKEYWREYINWLHTDYPYIKVSTSQYVEDIYSSQYNIGDLVDVIGVNFYPGTGYEKDCPTVSEMVESFLTEKYIKSVDEYCSNHNKKFIITECGCSCWDRQCAEPENGNSQILWFKKRKNNNVTRNYAQAACISSQIYKNCIGLALTGLGGNYDSLFLPSSFQLRDNLNRDAKGIEMIKEAYNNQELVYKHKSLYKPLDYIKPFDETEGEYFKLMTVDIPVDYVNSDIIASFDVFDNEIGGTNKSKKWDLTINISTANKNNFKKYGGIQVKLQGENRRCIATQEIITKTKGKRVECDVYTQKYGSKHDYCFELDNIKYYRFNIYIKINPGTFLFIKNKFLNTDMNKNDYKIHNLTYCVNDIITDKVINTFVSYKNTNFIEYKKNEIDNGINSLKLFTIDLNFDDVCYNEFRGVFDLSINYPAESKNKFINSSIKFEISGVNNYAKEVWFDAAILNKVNHISESLAFVRVDNTLEVWVKSCYPAKIRLKAEICDNLSSNVFILPINDEYTKKEFDKKCFDFKKI